MQALQRFGAILSADLRERSRGVRFWVVLGGMMLLAWWCFPSPEATHRIFTVTGGARADYSSAWVGLVLAMAFSLALNLGGFYLVRGTLVRDIETRVWQLLVATPMTRGGFLLAKWASHMAVFATILACGAMICLHGFRKEAGEPLLNDSTGPLFTLGVIGLAVTTWIGGIPSLRQKKPR